MPAAGDFPPARADNGKRVVRAVMGRALLAAIGVLIAAGAAETALRLSHRSRSFARPDADIGYVMTPGFARVLESIEHPAGQVTLRANNLGLRRDSDTPVEKPAHTIRVLVLGDSQTEGIVDNRDTYSTRLEGLLNRSRRGGRTVEVLNAAVSGYSPLLEYLWLRHRGMALRPDVIVMALYAGNDIAELLAHEINFGGYGPPFRIPSLEGDPGNWHLEYPGSGCGVVGRVDWMLDTYSSAYALARRAIPRGGPGKDTPLARLVAQCMGCLQSLPQAYVAQTDPEAFAAAFDRLGHVLKALKADSANAGSRLLVAVIPTKVEVEGQRAAEEVRKAVEVLGLQQSPADFDDDVRQRTLAISRGLDIATVDLLPALRSAFADRLEPLYWELDWHLNVAGHAAVAQSLGPAVGELIGR